MDQSKVEQDINQDNLKICTPLLKAGAYWLGEPDKGLGIFLSNRPNWWHKLWMKVCFNVVWTDSIEG